MKNINELSAGKAAEKAEPLHIAGGYVNWLQTLCTYNERFH
jgi:hypothetical protein